MELLFGLLWAAAPAARICFGIRAAVAKPSASRSASPFLSMMRLGCGGAGIVAMYPTDTPGRGEEYMRKARCGYRRSPHNYYNVPLCYSKRLLIFCMQYYAESLTTYKRLKTREVRVGHLTIGGNNPIAIQTMTTTDTMDTGATVAQTLRCIEAGAQLVRITAPSKNEAQNLKNIKDAVRAAGYDTPLVADIHFTPNAAEIAATLIENCLLYTSPSPRD